MLKKAFASDTICLLQTSSQTREPVHCKILKFAIDQARVMRVGTCTYMASCARDNIWSRDLAAILAGRSGLCAKKFSKQEKREASFCEESSEFPSEIT